MHKTVMETHMQETTVSAIESSQLQRKLQEQG